MNEGILSILAGFAWVAVVLALIFVIGEDVVDGFRIKKRGSIQEDNQ